MEHPILSAVAREGFVALGWFTPNTNDSIEAAFVILIGNAGPAMFNRFARDCDTTQTQMDDWTKQVVDPLAQSLNAKAVYPFDKPYPPFLTWARRASAGHVTPLGLNIRADYGLWHAYRAALLFPVAFDLPAQQLNAHPCETCQDKPCLSTCPVSAFDGSSYDVTACGSHLHSTTGKDCMASGCKARLACPVGRAYIYEPTQIQFHMNAFKKARAVKS